MQTEPLLRKLAKHRSSGPGQDTFVYQDADSGWTTTLTTGAVDTLGAEMWEVCVSRPAAAQPLDPIHFQKIVRDVADRVRGLMEPLHVHEIDAGRQQAILRSEAPSVRQGKRYHYELRLNGNHRADLRRYHASVEPTSKREPVPFALTKEVLGNYLEDVTEALG